MVYVIQVYWQLANRMRTELVSSWSCSQAVWHIPLLRVLWKTPDDGQRNCPKHVELYSKNKIEKLVHVVRFIIRRKIVLVSNCSIRVHCPIMNSVYSDSILTREKHSLSSHFVFLSLLFSPVDVSLRDSSSIQPKCWTPFVTEPLISLGNILMKPSSHVYRRRFPFFQRKIQNGNDENWVSKTCYTPQHFMMKLAPAKFPCNFLLFPCLYSICRCFEMPSRPLFL